MGDLEDESILNIDADNEVAKSTTRELAISIISADVQLLSSAILNISKRLDKLALRTVGQAGNRHVCISANSQSSTLCRLVQKPSMLLL